MQAALLASANLIVICSPRSVASRWVNEEIKNFAALGRAESIFCLIVEGEPHSADPSRECFPPALFAAGHHEPLAADVRPGQDGKSAAKVKLLSGLMGVGYDELRQREAVRKQRRLAIVAAFATLGLVFTTALAVFALISRAEAIAQRDIAERKTMTAERTVSFVKSLFEVSDPSEARGQTITAREILDKGARDIREGLQDEPAVKAELGTTLGEVYSGLGLYRQGDRLIREMMRLRHGDAATRTRQLLAFADAQARAGEYPGAIRLYGQALNSAKNPSQPREDLVPRILIGLGEALSATDKFAEAGNAIDQALKLDITRLGPAHPDVARDLEAHGLNWFYSGEIGKAQISYERALAIRLKAQGGLHPRVPENQNTLGAIAYMRGDSRAAAKRYQQALNAYMRVLGPDHPEVANTANNLARILLERRRYREALPLLERAVAINLRERGSDHDDIIFPFSNLALVKHELGDVRAARELLKQAASTARRHRHRALGPVLADLASIECGAGRTAEALRLLDESAQLALRDYKADPWRKAWVDNSRAFCLVKQRQQPPATELLKTSTKAILMKWQPESHFGSIALSRLGSVER